MQRHTHLVSGPRERCTGVVALLLRSKTKCDSQRSGGVFERTWPHPNKTGVWCSNKVAFVWDTLLDETRKRVVVGGGPIFETATVPDQHGPFVELFNSANFSKFHAEELRKKRKIRKPLFQPSLGAKKMLC